MTGRPKAPPGKKIKQLSIGLRQEDIERLRIIAEKLGTGISQVARELIMRGIGG